MKYDMFYDNLLLIMTGLSSKEPVSCFATFNKIHVMDLPAFSEVINPVHYRYVWVITILIVMFFRNVFCSTNNHQRYSTSTSTFYSFFLNFLPVSPSTYYIDAVEGGCVVATRWRHFLNVYIMGPQIRDWGPTLWKGYLNT